MVLYLFKIFIVSIILFLLYTSQSYITSEFQTQQKKN